MKKIFWILVLFIPFIAGACSEDEEDISIRKFSNTGCKSFTRAGENTETAQEYIEYKGTTDNYLQIHHINALFSCDEGNIVTTISTNDNVIYVTESKEGEKTNCICHYDLNYEIGPLEAKTYTIIFNSGEKQFSIDFHQGLTGIFSNK